MIPIHYEPPVLGKADNDEILRVLWEDLAWVQQPGVPRKEYFATDKGQPYTYGTPPFARTYQPQPWTEDLLTLKTAAEGIARCEFDVCFLNGYADERDQLGWHADDSPEMDDARPIVIISFGAEREIWFRNNPALWEGECKPYGTDVDLLKVKMESGSIIVMAPGMQDTHQHRIPKAGFKCGPRVSLTFRGLV